MQLSTNTLLQGGKYKIEKVLGQGGFGITYLGTQMALNRKVAIKEFFMKEYCERDDSTSQVSLGSSGSRETVERFRQKFIKEAQNIAGLSHPHIIRIYDIFEENGTAYYVMEHINNGSLSDLVKERERLSEEEALYYIRQIADALEYIHERNMNHLDIKPSNILLDDKMNAVLIDFGLSKRYDEEGNQTSTTPVGISHGYAPIEQYKKGGVGTFSPATDIYSLGATLYKLVTGKTPPEATDLMDDELPPLPTNISKQTAFAIKKAMQAGRKNRPQSVDEFLALLGDGEVAVNVSNKEMPKVVDEVTVIVGHDSDLPQVKEKPSLDNPNFINGHEFVDLGLSVKWATCNVGAEKPEDYGDYFAWGETSTKSEYTKANCKTWEVNLGNIADNSRYDAARANWGGTWRLPTKAECEELDEKCTWTWTTQGGHNGYKVTGPNGNSIFLPAAGYRDGTSLLNAGESGYYWSSTPNESNTQGAYNLNFSSGYHYVYWYYRYRGLSVRPVSN